MKEAMGFYGIVLPVAIMMWVGAISFIGTLIYALVDLLKKRRDSH